MNKPSNIYLLLSIVSLIFGCRESNTETAKKPIPKLSVADSKAQKKKWEASPDGIKYKKWETSAEGVKVQASADKIRKQLNDFSDMEAVVLSVSPQMKSMYGFGVLVSIDGDKYLLNNSLRQLKSLKVNDTIIIRSRYSGSSPKSPYLIVSGDYIKRNGKLVYKRPINKDGC
jgi:hypothetical protein